MAVKRRNKSVYISVYSYIIPTFWLKNPMFPGVFVSIIDNFALTKFEDFLRFAMYHFYKNGGALP